MLRLEIAQASRFRLQLSGEYQSPEYLLILLIFFLSILGLSPTQIVSSKSAIFFDVQLWHFLLHAAKAVQHSSKHKTTKPCQYVDGI